MNEKLKKEEIMAALNERHSPEKQALLSECRGYHKPEPSAIFYGASGNVQNGCPEITASED